jgi:hypothetical protein
LLSPFPFFVKIAAHIPSLDAYALAAIYGHGSVEASISHYRNNLSFSYNLIAGTVFGTYAGAVASRFDLPLTLRYAMGGLVVMLFACRGKLLVESSVNDAEHWKL